MRNCNHQYPRHYLITEYAFQRLPKSLQGAAQILSIIEGMNRGRHYFLTLFDPRELQLWLNNKLYYQANNAELLFLDKTPTRGYNSQYIMECILTQQAYRRGAFYNVPRRQKPNESSVTSSSLSSSSPTNRSSFFYTSDPKITSLELTLTEEDVYGRAFQQNL